MFNNNIFNRGVILKAKITTIKLRLIEVINVLETLDLIHINILFRL